MSERKKLREAWQAGFEAGRQWQSSEDNPDVGMGFNPKPENPYPDDCNRWCGPKPHGMCRRSCAREAGHPGECDCRSWSCQGRTD